MPPKSKSTYWEIPVDPDVLARFPAPTPEGAVDPLKEKLKDGAVEQLRTIIATRLTERQRDIVERYFFLGQTEAEIAAELGIAQQVVSKHLFGALRAGRRVGGAIAKLRKLAAGQDIDPEKWV
jgi:DNA-directed RNA polymerase specialized sigma24 family protein